MKQFPNSREYWSAWWLHCEQETRAPAFTPAWDVKRCMWSVAGDFFVSFADAREAQAFRRGVTKATEE